MTRLLTFTFFIAFLTAKGQQQSLASPSIINYSMDRYLAGAQNWAIWQDTNRIMYFGNNEGLLTFNGNFWKLNQLPNRTVIRSIGADQNQRIYIGGQDEIGYFSPNKEGKLLYHSLKSLIPEKERQFGDVWNLAINNHDVFFRESNKIFLYKNKEIHVFKPRKYWTFLGELDGKVFAQDSEEGLLTYNDGYWKLLFKNQEIGNSLVTGILRYDSSTFLITTLDKGLYLYTYRDGLSVFKSTLTNKLIESNIYKALKIQNGVFAFGTTSDGIIVMNKKGDLIEHYTHSTGLQTNNVRSLFLDRDHHLWVGLDDGIDFIPFNDAIKYIYPDNAKLVTGYSALKFNDQLYFGTSNGVYSFTVNSDNKDLSKSKATFIPIKNSFGQVWNLQNINEKVFVSHDKGLFQIEGGRAISIYDSPGTWILQATTKVYPATDILMGTYTGIGHLSYSEKFINRGLLDNLNESIRFMFTDPNNQSIWASHPYRGIYNFSISPDFKSVVNLQLHTEKTGLPSYLYNYIFNIGHQIMAATKDGIYHYNSQKGRFEPDSILHPLTKGLSLQYLKQDENENIWFISEKKVGVISRLSGQLSLQYIPELDNKIVGGHESIFPYDDENIFIGANKGFIHLNYAEYRNQMVRPSVTFNNISAFGRVDSILHGGYPLAEEGFNQQAVPSLPYQLNSIHFDYASPSYGKSESLTFSYKLEGFDHDWSTWDNKYEKDYTNLSPGKYTFLVKARDEMNESPVKRYSFIISPPWYKTRIAYTLYILFTFLTIYFLMKWQKKKYQEAHAQQKYLHDLEIASSEQEIIRLKNEKLEAEVTFKDKELTAMTLHLIQRGEVLNSLKDSIKKGILKKNKDSAELDFKPLLRIIREAERTEEDWEHFSAHFNHVNAFFFEKLREEYPEITQNELKLCAYLKMNLTSKEIAQLMNITIKAVEVSRYRLRKKLQLSSDINLNNFLYNFSKTT